MLYLTILLDFKLKFKILSCELGYIKFLTKKFFKNLSFFIKKMRLKIIFCRKFFTCNTQKDLKTKNIEQKFKSHWCMNYYDDLF